MFGVSGLRCRLLRDQGRSLPAQALLYAGWSALWLLGHITGGALLGALLGAAGAAIKGLAGAWMMAFASFACLAWCLHHLEIFRAPMPQWHRQVQRDWMQRYPWSLVAVGYGLQLGCSVLTRIRVATVYAVLVCALLSGSAWDGVLFGAAFGLSRGLPAAIVGPLVASPALSLRVAAALNSKETAVRRANALMLLLMSCIFAVAAYSRIAG